MNVNFKVLSIIASVATAGLGIASDRINAHQAVDKLAGSKELEELVAKKVAEALKK